MNFEKLKYQYKNELLNNVIPFWLQKSQDLKYGGYFTCLDRQGNIFDTDKFIWLQGRQVWMFSMLYNNVENRQEWLDCAKQGGEFLKKHGHDGNFNWYFSLTREGKPLVEPYNIFSYTFATMAFGQLSKVTGNKEHADIAKKTFDIILARRDNLKDKWNKAHPETRNLKSFSLPMILCNLAIEIEHLLEPDFLQKTIDESIHEVMEVFLRPELGGIIVENINMDGSLSDTFDGRLINPGHGIEAMWFIMDLGVRLNRPQLIEKAVETTLKILNYGWDQKYSGIFYFMDRKGFPPQQLEWDQKLWWVHIESLISLIKGYQLTGSKSVFPGSKKFTIMHGRILKIPNFRNGGDISIDKEKCCSI